MALELVRGYVPLVVLTAQSSISILVSLLHHSRVHTGRTYSAPGAVLLVELIKGFVALGVTMWRLRDEGPKGSSEQPWRERVRETSRLVAAKVFVPGALRMYAVPAVLFVGVNNLQYVAATNLDVPTFQVVSALKVMLGALVTALVLVRRLSARRWAALVGIGLGIATVQIATMDVTQAGHEHLDRQKGFAAAGTACVLSALAGGYLELVLKGSESESDFWIQNLQLATRSILPALVPIIAPSILFQFQEAPGASSSEGGLPFTNLDRWAWGAILTLVVGGFLSSTATRRGEVPLATASSGLLTFSLTATLSAHYRPSFAFTIGTLLVLASTFAYSQSERRPSGMPKLTSGARRPVLRLLKFTHPTAGYHLTSPHSSVLATPPRTPTLVVGGVIGVPPTTERASPGSALTALRAGKTPPSKLFDLEPPQGEYNTPPPSGSLPQLVSFPLPPPFTPRLDTASSPNVFFDDPSSPSSSPHSSLYIYPDDVTSNSIFAGQQAQAPSSTPLGLRHSVSSGMGDSAHTPDLSLAYGEYRRSYGFPEDGIISREITLEMPLAGGASTSAVWLRRTSAAPTEGTGAKPWISLASPFMEPELGEVKPMF